MKNLSYWHLALILVGMLGAPREAAAILPCELKCTPSTSCSAGCYDDEGDVITCDIWGVCANGPVYDLVEWMVPSYAGHTSTHLEQTAPGNNGIKSEFITCPGFPNGFFRVSSLCGDLQERFTYDSQNIYITRETFKPLTANHFKTHSNFVWIKRHMRSGDSFVADCSWREHTSCAVPPVTPCSIPVRLKGPVTLALGGDVGTVQALVVEHVVGSGFVEKYFYAKPWGYVKFEFRQPSGALVYKEDFNKIVAGNLLPHTSACFALECPGQVGSCP